MSNWEGLSHAIKGTLTKGVAVRGGLYRPAPVPMHIPDGFLSTPVALVLWLVAVVGIAYALYRVRREMDERKVPLMGVMAAAIFAGQMLNFSVTGGTSGHLLGAALAVIVLGPWAAVLVLACVVGTQALLFQDGGLLALGANTTNMALIGVIVAYAAYHTVRKLAGVKPWGLPVSGFVAGWLSIVIAALGCALELALSGTSPANVAVPAMGSIHILIGVGEGLITAAALALLYASRSDLLTGQAPATGGRGVWVAGLLIAVVLAVLSPLASTHPDGLEWVAEQKGFLDAARSAPIRVIPDYVFPGIPNEAVATILAGILGVAVVFAAAWLVGASGRRRSSERHL